MKTFKSIMLDNYVVRMLWFLLFSAVPVAFILTSTSTWAPLFLLEKGVLIPMSNTFLFFWNICLSLGLLVLCWVVDKIFCKSRWLATIFFQVGLIILLLFFWLCSNIFTSNIYLYFMSGVIAFTLGAVISIFIVVMELVSRKALATTIGSAFIFVYFLHKGSIVLSGMLIDGLGWNGYFTTVFLTGVLANLALWFCRPGKNPVHCK